jgi:hypothetical protein
MVYKNESGATSLLVISLLLVAALVFTLGSYRTLFYQIKRAQNEVKSRQQHWVAEGGLECIFSKARLKNIIPSTSSITECNVNGDIQFSYSTPSEKLREVTAKYGYAEVKKMIKHPGTGASGVMKATSNLYFAGGMTMRPDPGQSLGNDEWGCTMLRFSNDFKVFGTIQNQNLHNNLLPYKGFPLDQECRGKAGDSYVTSTSGNYNTPSSLKKDFVHDAAQKPFEDLFEVGRGEWFDVMSLDGFVKIANDPLTDAKGKMIYQKSNLPTPKVVSNCGTKITNAIKSGKDLIWVYGSCHLDSSDLSSIGKAITPTLGTSPIPGGVILMIHNGLLSTSGSLNFKGMIYHFISNNSDGTPEFVPDADLWNALDEGQKNLLDGTVGPVSGVETANTAYFQNGSFYPIGGYVMDAPGTYAVYNSSISFSFNRDVIEIPLTKLKKLKWKAGSWYAN